MQQRGELRVWWRERIGTSVLLTAALLAACDGKIGGSHRISTPSQTR